MRLDKDQRAFIVSTLENIFGSVKIYLFGSRLNDDKKGGDIDLFVIAEENSNLFEKKIKALSQLERILHKPVDLVLHKNFEREIEKEILKNSLLLH